MWVPKTLLFPYPESKKAACSTATPVRTRKFKRRGGVPINKSTMYNIFTNIFYTGLFIYRGEISNGTHEPMITVEDFDKVQLLLGRYGRPRAKTHSFAYTGTMLCGECSSSVTACEKTKLVKATGKLKDYVFYYCSHRKQGAQKCTQRRFIPLSEMETIIKAEIDKYTISAKFRDWALRILQEEHSSEAAEREAIYNSQLCALETTQRELDMLITMRMRELINDDEYVSRKRELMEKIAIFKQKVSETQNRAHNWLKYTEEAFDFAHTAKARFDDPETTLEEKKSIFTSLGGNYILKDGKLYISQCKYLEPIAKKRKAVEVEINRSELENKFALKGQNTHLGVLCPVLRERRDLNP